MDLNHLYLRVRDLDRSVAFYRLFAFDGTATWQGETFVIGNGAGFSLALTPDAMPPRWPDGLHIGFLLDSVADAQALRRTVHAPRGRVVRLTALRRPRAPDLQT